MRKRRLHPSWLAMTGALALQMNSCSLEIDKPKYNPDTSGTREQCKESCGQLYSQCMDEPKGTPVACAYDESQCENKCISDTPFDGKLGSKKT